jgi:uncharacterized protein (TIGR03067 family)
MAIDLTGSWRAVYSEVNGEMTPVAYTSGIVMTFQGNTFEIKVHDVVEHEGTFSINDSVSPAQITYIYTKSSSYELNKPRVGILQRVGSTFKDSLGPIGAPPPSGFNTAPLSNSVMTIHQLVGAESGRGLWTTFAVSPTAAVSQW